MKIITYTTLALAVSLSLTLLVFSTVLAADFSFQPRLEAGLVQYSFESGSIGRTIPSESVGTNTGYTFTQRDFKYSDTMPVLGVGATFFLNRFFFDFSGQFALNGESSAIATFSGFNAEKDESDSIYIAAEPIYEASFDRTDIAVSIGYSFDGGFGVFAGYKRSKTDFDTTYQGRLGAVSYDGDGTKMTAGGRLFGDARFNFNYNGPFIGAIQGWEFGDDCFLKGMLTTTLALAHLNGEVEVEDKNFGLTISWADGQEVPESTSDLQDGGVSNRFDTKGEALGFSLGVGWRGTTAVDGLSYFLNISGYRYEFEADDDPSQSDINETAIVYKAGFSYAF